MRVEVTALAPLPRSEVRRLKRTVRRISRRLLPRGSGELCVALVTEEEMRDLNRRYRGIDEPTDVLAFPMDAPGEPDGGAGGWRGPLGDIAVCVPVAQRQASQRGETRLEELEVLAAHGFLHLLGYDDSDEEGAASMAEMENGLLGRNIVR